MSKSEYCTNLYMLRGQKVLYQSVCPRSEDKTINFCLFLCSRQIVRRLLAYRVSMRLPCGCLANRTEIQQKTCGVFRLTVRRLSFRMKITG